jgi:peptidoglycan/LPS O-acetylase OafA/YrhL
MPPRINNVQALRGFAALLVVLGHTRFTLPRTIPFGPSGVDIFFVISGFIMAMICNRNPEKFFLRRLIRILPLYWAATLGVYILAMLAPNLMKTTRAVPWELALSLLFVPFFKESGTANPILFVGWTLNYEMFFYVVLAICLAVNRKRAPLLASVVIFVTILACRPFRGRWGFTSLYGQWLMLEFVLGMAAYALVRATTEARARRLRWLAALCAVVAAFGVPVLEGLPQFAALNWDRLIDWGLPAFVLVLSAALLSKGGADTRVQFLVLLGDASYVIYIIHTYVLDGMERLLVPKFPALELSTALGSFVSLAFVTLLSIGIYLWAEKPAVDWLSVKFATRRIARPEVKDPAESMA